MKRHDPPGDGPDEARLREELRVLQEGYRSQPPIIQQEDLAAINAIRSRLGMSPVDGRLAEFEVNPVEQNATRDAVLELAAPDEVDPHREARALYRRYLEREERLEPFRRHADRVALATAGSGMTPVQPLATMGTGGGPLLCDFCHKPIPLERGRFHGKSADVAWAENPDPDWASWILGGLIVEIATNHTLRIYHGYPAQKQACYGKATAAEASARQEFDGGVWSRNEAIVAAFVQDELSSGLDAREQRALVDRILDALFNYDPGVGGNQP